jgi:transposase InsO family protein
MQERNELINAWLSREFNISQLSRRFGVSRKTVYKFIKRFEQEGRAGLADISRAPHVQANQTSIAQCKLIIKFKHRFPTWGPVTLKDYLTREYPASNWPAASTIGRILKQAGLVKRRHKRYGVPPFTAPLAHADAPNKVWSADFKGQFKLGNDKVCYPLTLTDNHSRYLLACKGLYGIRLSGVQPVYERLFREYGLPDAIRTDNGYPFSQVCLGGLSPLAIWLVKLGIVPERIDKGCPQQNGRHERMHRTLKEAVISPAAKNLSAQQRAFNRFQHQYNELRPHRSLLGKTPSSHYSASERHYPSTLPEPEYHSEWEIRKVKCAGQLKLHGQPIYISRQLIGEYVGLRPLENHQWQLYFYKHPLGIVDEKVGRVIRPT